MTKKEVARKVLLVFSFGWIFGITIKFLMGTADTFSTIYMFIFYSIWALNLILSMVLNAKNEYKLYKNLVNCFKDLQTAHKILYKLYFTENSEKVEKYASAIKKYGNALINSCENSISSNLLSKKHVKKIEEILKKTKDFMTTIN